MKFLARKARDFASVIGSSLHGFFSGKGIVYAASLSYFGIVAMVPMCLFIAGIFGLVLGQNSEFFTFFLERLLGLFPAITAGVTRELSKLIEFRELALSSIFLYALLSYQLYAGIYRAMEEVFRVQTRRRLAQRLLMPLVVVTLLMVLLFTSFALTTFIKIYNVLSTIESMDAISMVPELGIGKALSFSLSYALPLLILAATFTIIYKVVPHKRVHPLDAFLGGLFTAVMIEVAKHLFTWYMGTVSQLGTIYGSLSAFVIFLIWVFYCACIFILGAEIVHTLDTRAARDARRPGLLRRLMKRKLSLRKSAHK